MKALICSAALMLPLSIGTTSGAEPDAQVQPAQAPASSVPTPQTAAKIESWREAIVHTKRPKKSCFVAHYPDTTWTEMPCGAPPNTTSGPARGPRPLTVGGGNDLSAQVESGHISQAEGSFDLVTGVTSETMVLNDGREFPNVFALQLNTNFGLITTACNGVSTCRGWQQFIFSNSGCGDPTPACIYVESWVFGYSSGTNCPPGRWVSTSPGQCKVDSAMAARFPPIPLSALGTATLRGTVAGVDGPDDLVVLTVGPTAYSAPGDNDIPEVGQQWQVAEFNIVGNGDYSVANFNPGSTLVVRTSVDSGTTSAPSCDSMGTTGETNNLTLTSMAFVHPINAPPAKKSIQIGHQPSPVYPVPWSGWPSLVFTESNVPGVVAASCDAAVTVGGTTEGSVSVPKVVGRPVKYASAILTASHLVPMEVSTAGCKDPGVVSEQAPVAGSVVRGGSSVTITFNQPKPGTCQAD